MHISDPRIVAGTPMTDWSWSWRCGVPAALTPEWVLDTTTNRGNDPANSHLLDCGMITQPVDSSFDASFQSRLWYGLSSGKIGFMVAEDTSPTLSYFYPDFTSCQETPMLHIRYTDSALSRKGMTRALSRSTVDPVHSCRLGGALVGYEHQDPSPVEAGLWVR